MKPKISIITVCYNAIETIEKTINSVLSQEYDNFEYIIIDGGSTDGTKDIILKYADYLSYWVSEKDNGIYDAMNKGIAVASGDWITFRNSGDYFLSSMSLQDFFKDTIEDDVAVIHGKCYWINDWGYYEKEPEILHYPYDIGVMPVIHPSTFVRSLIHKKYLFDTQYKSSADYDLFYRLLKDNFKFTYRPINIVVFNIVGFSTINWDLSYFENCRIIGKNKIMTHIGYLNLLAKYTMQKIIDNNKFFKKFKINKMINQGWKLLPIK